MSLLLEYCQDLNILTEAFYGKPKEFIEIEKRLDKIINMIKLQKENPSMAVDINKMKELEEIENIFTKFFKNYKTSITFYAPIISPTYNAFTFPSTLSYFKKDPNNKRIASVDDLFINVNVDMGLVYALDMDAKELMAVILHEIGHCFDASLFMLLSKIQIIGSINYDLNTMHVNSVNINAVNSIYSTFINLIIGASPLLQSFYQEMNRFVSQNPTLNKFLSDIQMVIADISTFLNIVSFSLKKITPVLLVQQLLNPSNVFGYANEKFADSFATSYGYGKEVASFSYKVQHRKGLTINENISKIPLLNIGYDFLKVSMQLSTIILDPHPHDATRIQSQLNKLKRDLNNPNLDSKVKKELLDNIVEMENYIDNIVLNINHEDNNGRWITLLQNYIIIKVFKGRIDPRELFEAVWNHEL